MTDPLRGRWAFRKRKHSKPLMAHLISSEGWAFCGRHLNHGEVMDACWNPDDHPAVVCTRCLEWYHACMKRQEPPTTPAEPFTTP